MTLWSEIMATPAECERAAHKADRPTRETRGCGRVIWARGTSMRLSLPLAHGWMARPIDGGEPVILERRELPVDLR